MTTRQELCFVESFTREMFSGRGRIVDLGCWYGATTAALARGLLHNNEAVGNRVVEAFDLFTWQKWMMRHAHRFEHLGKRYEDNDSFLEDVRELLRPYAEVVRLEERDLLARPDTPEEPIEFLFIDAQKSWPLGQSIAQVFFPALIPGISYVVQQDFVWYHPTILSVHLLMWHLRRHFEFVHHVPRSCSSVFRCVESLDPAETPLPPPDSFTLEMIDEAYDWALGCAEPARHDYIKAGKLFSLLERRLYEAALECAMELFVSRREVPVDLVKGMAPVLSSYRGRAETATAAAGGKPAVEYLADIEALVAHGNPPTRSCASSSE